MKIIDTVLGAVDSWQRKRTVVAFGYAVVKKYGDDQAGYQAALFTYYAFLSLFPLLLVLTTVTAMLVGSHSALHNDIIHSITNYFPGLGSQITSNTATLHGSGVALVIGLLFTLYGARGVADAFRNGVNHIWWVPKAKRTSFPASILKSLSIIIVGGIGFIGAAIIASFAASVGHGVAFRAVSIALNLVILFLTFSFLINISLPRHVTFKQIRSGALAAAIGLVILQTFGSFLLSRELKHLDAVYSYFAIALGLIFWIYLQAQMLFYAVEIAAVKHQKAWPRSLTGAQPTPFDERVKKQQAYET